MPTSSTHTLSAPVSPILQSHGNRHRAPLSLGIPKWDIPSVPSRIRPPGMDHRTAALAIHYLRTQKMALTISNMHNAGLKVDPSYFMLHAGNMS